MGHCRALESLRRCWSDPPPGVPPFSPRWGSSGAEQRAAELSPSDDETTPTPGVAGSVSGACVWCPLPESSMSLPSPLRSVSAGRLTGSAPSRYYASVPQRPRRPPLPLSRVWRVLALREARRALRSRSWPSWPRLGPEHTSFEGRLLSAALQGDSLQSTALPVWLCGRG